ncbi:outer membrane beta-barrel protein [Alteromonas gracilis]|uniref:outer membrane beta-barrel protein n=1 Tax=Alteromonas gracilis TaxID=1479524 RepID=UPI002FE3FB80
MNNMQKKCLVTVLSAIVCGKTIAQTPASIELGGFDLYPSLKAEFGHDDNVLRDDDSEVESWKSTIAPEFILVNSFGLNTIQAGYRLERGNYFSSQADSYTDHLFNLAGNFELNVRHRVSFEAVYKDDHDERGTAFTIGQGDIIDTPDQYKSSKVDVTYSYGALTTKGRIDLTAGYLTTDYDIDTPLYRSRDRSTNSLGGTFYYQIMPATDLTFDVIYNNIDYDFALDPTTPLDSEEVRALVGVEWDTTAKTTGYFKIGHRQKEFDDGSREDFSGLDWRIGVTWSPRTYSTVDFTTFTNTNETNGVGDFIDTQTYQLSWDHEWLDRLSTTVKASYSEDEYTGSNASRVDDNITTMFTVNYVARRYMVVQAGFTHDRRNSNEDIIDFDRNIVSLTVNITL